MVLVQLDNPPTGGLAGFGTSREVRVHPNIYVLITVFRRVVLVPKQLNIPGFALEVLSQSHQHVKIPHPWLGHPTTNFFNRESDISPILAQVVGTGAYGTVGGRLRPCQLPVVLLLQLFGSDATSWRRELFPTDPIVKRFDNQLGVTLIGLISDPLLGPLNQPIEYANALVVTFAGSKAALNLTSNFSPMQVRNQSS